jgi:streptogramin lyase
MATNLKALTLIILAAAAASAQQFNYTDAGGTVTLGADLTIAGAAVVNPAGTLSVSCPVTSVPPGTYRAEWVCSGGAVTIQSNDGLTALTGNLTSGTFVETATGGGHGTPITYYYTFTGAFTGALSLGGQAQAITGAITQSLAGSQNHLGTGTLASGTTFVNTEYEPVYVADTGNSRIVRIDDMFGANWVSFGTAGAGTSQFQSPYGIFVNPKGSIYVTDNLNCRVVRFDDMAGKNWTSFGTCGSGNLQFNNPTGLAVDSSGRIYITDTGNNRVVRVSDMAGDGWVSYGVAGTGTGQFASPVGVALDSAGKVYVSDTNNARIVRMDDMAGTNWTTFSGLVPNQLGAPVAISLDGAGRIYILDWYYAHVFRTDDMTGTNFAQSRSLSIPTACPSTPPAPSTWRTPMTAGLPNSTT